MNFINKKTPFIPACTALLCLALLFGGAYGALPAQAAENNNGSTGRTTVHDVLGEQSVGVLSVLFQDETADTAVKNARAAGPVPESAGTVSESAQAADAASLTGDEEYGSLAIADVHDYVNVRSTPGTDGDIVGKMYDGSVAQILSVSGEGTDIWFQVVSGNVEGYIKAEYFIYGDAAAAVIDDYVTRYAQVKADRLNVRKEPSTDSSRIGYLDNGERVKILEQGGEWHKVQYTDSSTGYVSAEFVTVVEEFIHAKSLEEERAEREAQRKAAARAAEAESAAPENTDAPADPSSEAPSDYGTNDELRASIVEYALQFVGNKYVHGGQSLTGGTDCSGFTCYIYADFGYSLSRTPQGQWSSDGRSISADDIRPGDIVCYSSGGSKCTHVALYIGDGQIVHAANSKRGVVVDSMYYDDTYIGVKNVID